MAHCGDPIRRQVREDEPVVDVAKLLATAEGVEPTELPPLHGAVGGLLPQFFAEAPPDAEVAVTFTVEGHKVTVERHGMATVEPVGE